MSVTSETFGGVRLSAQDAEKFKNQITYGRPKAAAAESLARGQKLLKEYAKKGYVAVKPRP